MSIVKIILAVSVCIAYFTSSAWLSELVVVSVVLSLLLPLGFYGAFIENLIEYNTQVVEDRQLLNANEANEHFNKMSIRIAKLENELEKR